AVANKYAHTAQGVFELRYFFSESVQGPEGGNTSLLILKRRVKKWIDEEDPTRPLTDEQITRILQSQGIQVTRRTVAKYREDMRIPSTHQSRSKEYPVVRSTWRNSLEGADERGIHRTTVRSNFQHSTRN